MIVVADGEWVFSSWVTWANLLQVCVSARLLRGYVGGAVCVLNPSVVVTARVGNGFKAWSGRGQPTALHGGQYLVMLALWGRNKAQWAAKGAGHGTCE